MAYSGGIATTQKTVFKFNTKELFLAPYVYVIIKAFYAQERPRTKSP